MLEPLATVVDLLLRWLRPAYDTAGYLIVGVAVGRYASAVGAFVPFTAGLGRMPYRRFLLWDVPAIVVWATGITVFGYAAGRNLDLIDKVLSRFGYIMLGILVGFVGGRWLWK